MQKKRDDIFVLTAVIRASRTDDLASRIRTAWRLEPVQIERPGSTRAWLDVYFPDATQAMLAERAIRAIPGVSAVSVRPYVARNWRRYLKTVFRSQDVGRRLRVCPVWERARRMPPGRRRILINPGMSFGTGDHFTTRFCLETIDEICSAHSPRSMLDVGTGSGILAIAAARLGVKRVLAVDNDAQALEQAAENAALNRLSKRIRLKKLDITKGGPRGRFDLVCANLFGTMLIESATSLAHCARRWLALSGIREAEADSVADAFVSQGGRERIRDGNGEWAGMMFEFGRY